MADRFFRSVFYIPTLTPYAVAALIWLFVFQRDFGALNMTLDLVGFRRATGSVTRVW